MAAPANEDVTANIASCRELQKHNIIMTQTMTIDNNNFSIVYIISSKIKRH